MSQSVASLVAGLLYVLAALTSIFVFIVCLRKHTRTRTFKTKSWMLAFLNLALSLFLMSVFLIFDYPKILVLSFAFLFSWGAIGIWVLFLGRLIPYAGQRIVTYIISMLPLLFIPVFIFSEPVGIFDVAHSMYMVMLLLAAGTVSLLFLAWFFGYIKSRLDDFFQFAAISVFPIVVAVWLIYATQAVSAFLISALLFIAGLSSLAYTWVNYGQKTD
ncbi:MAG TPA: hypothetical protein PKV16_01550 [Caldisericia bacterium]|nr:hypothetical protein [Caldisericia bacterium]HPF48909.1 hypothetical protein [Caldisericia bacterium]HPI83227.1 hypothetical protein [Caldisericia bacterium]HPQ92454.1 hypothetical protein [Caldisericia bacterium]HRV74448.1 hypothetical protein [Caldisericia bacterium]